MTKQIGRLNKILPILLSIAVMLCSFVVLASAFEMTSVSNHAAHSSYTSRENGVFEAISEERITQSGNLGSEVRQSSSRRNLSVLSLSVVAVLLVAAALCEVYYFEYGYSAKRHLSKYFIIRYIHDKDGQKADFLLSMNQ